MIVTHEIDMDLQIRGIPPRLAMAQCDTDTRIVALRLLSGGESWIPGAVDRVLVRYRKSDGTGGSYDTMPDGGIAWELEENALRLRMAPQVLTAAGIVEMQTAMFQGEKCLATFCFQIAVEADPSIGAVESEDYVNWVQWAEAEAKRLLGELLDSGYAVNKTYVDGKRFSAEVTLTAGGWVQGEEGWTQSVAVEGILESDWPHYGVVYSEEAQKEKLAFARVDDLRTEDGGITVFCFGKAPEQDLVIRLEVNR